MHSLSEGFRLNHEPIQSRLILETTKSDFNYSYCRVDSNSKKCANVLKRYNHIT